MAGVHLWFCIYGAGLGVHTHGLVILLSFSVLHVVSSLVIRKHTTVCTILLKYFMSYLILPIRESGIHLFSVRGPEQHCVRRRTRVELMLSIESHPSLSR